MNSFAFNSVRKILENAFDFLYLRKPSATKSIDYRPVSDPRARLLHHDTRPTNEAQPNAETESVHKEDNKDCGIIYREDREEGSLNRSTVELESASNEVARLRSELKLLQEKNNSLQLTLQNSQSQSRQKDALIEDLQARNEQLEVENRESQRLAEERRVEVKSLEQFLSKTDTWAGADMVQTMKDMNLEILQFSASASESYTSDDEEPMDGPERSKALEKVAARFGSRMRQCLEDRDHMEDPTMLQYAIQSCVCLHIHHALSSFCFGVAGRFDQQLSKLHRHMHETGMHRTYEL